MERYISGAAWIGAYLAMTDPNASIAEPASGQGAATGNPIADSNQAFASAYLEWTEALQPIRGAGPH